MKVKRTVCIARTVTCIVAVSAAFLFCSSFLIAATWDTPDPDTSGIVAHFVPGDGFNFIHDGLFVAEKSFANGFEIEAAFDTADPIFRAFEAGFIS